MDSRPNENRWVTLAAVGNESTTLDINWRSLYLAVDSGKAESINLTKSIFVLSYYLLSNTHEKLKVAP